MSYLTDAVVEAISKQVTKKLKDRIDSQWGIVLSELQHTREVSKQLMDRLSLLENQMNSQNEAVANVHQKTLSALRHNKENREKASQLLTEAIKDLGLPQS